MFLVKLQLDNYTFRIRVYCGKKLLSSMCTLSKAGVLLVNFIFGEIQQFFCLVLSLENDAGAH